jgi:LPS sulfotransferase NodH
MAFIIGGHPRSGTTLLFQLFRDHPQIGITGEFHCFSRIGERMPSYAAGLRWKWYERPLLRNISRHAPWKTRLRSGTFLFRYLLFLSLRTGVRAVDLADVEAVLQHTLRKSVVGDKYPRYVFRLDMLCALPDLKRVMIYRDGRDVVSSYLKKDRAESKGLRELKTARQTAERWVESVEATERHRSELFVIRYEDFVRDPAPILGSLAGYLGVDPAGFRTEKIHDRSIGKHEAGLTTEELRDILAIAGGTLTRLGYL